MKIYLQDCEWRGLILVIANNETEAREKGEYNYEPDNTVSEEEIKHGFIFSDLGDC